MRMVKNEEEGTHCIAGELHAPASFVAGNVADILVHTYQDIRLTGGNKE